MTCKFKLTKNKYNEIDEQKFINKFNKFENTKYLFLK